MKGSRDGNELDERYVVGRIEIERFQEVNEECDYDYRGYWYTVNCGIYFCAGRVYDDRPLIFHVDRISPPSHGHAVRHPQSVFFSKFILKFLSFDQVEFLDPTGDTYLFSPATEEFVKQA